MKGEFWIIEVVQTIPGIINTGFASTADLLIFMTFS